jgi:phosphohistidine phosphatase
MKVLLVRHAAAEDRQEFASTGKPDTQRPLTRDGKEKMRRLAQAAAVLVPDLDVIASSALTRAMQTARLLSAAYSDTEIVRLDSLAPEGSHSAVVEWLAKHANLRCVAMVGHEPSLGALLALLTIGGPTSYHDFKKGGMALLSFQGKPAAGSARLEWALTPAVARLVKSSRAR